jgi:hypothetical protein
MGIKKRNLRIFIGLQELAGYYTNLKKGFDEVGVETVFVNLCRDRFQYIEKDELLVVNILNYLGKQRLSVQQTNRLLSIGLMICCRFLKLLLFIWAMIRFDVFIFGFGSTFFQYHELPILKIFKKRIIYMFHGSDCRPPFIDGGIIALHDKNIPYDLLYSLTLQQKRHLLKIEQYADIIVSYPLYAHFLEKPFINSFLLGVPFVSHATPPSPQAQKQQNTLRILHAPSDTKAKGTLVIQKTLTALTTKGHPIEYIELKDKPNKIVLAELANCDFVIDQLYSDTPMAGFATEAAFFGKPAVVGGYGWQEIEHLFASGHIPPSQRCHPKDLESAIEQLIVDQDYRRALGKKAKEFVEANWTSQKVAKRYLQLITGEFPPQWLYNPYDIHYLYGSGLSEQHVQQIVRTMIEAGGKDALQLSDKPELERLFVEFSSVPQ